MTAFRRERMPLLWEGGGGEKCLCLQKNEAAWKWCTQWKGGRDRQGVSQRKGRDRQSTVSDLFWLGPVASEELEEHDHVCLR